MNIQPFSFNPKVSIIPFVEQQTGNHETKKNISEELEMDFDKVNQ